MLLMMMMMVLLMMVMLLMMVLLMMVLLMMVLLIMVIIEQTCQNPFHRALRGYSSIRHVKPLSLKFARMQRAGSA